MKLHLATSIGGTAAPSPVVPGGAPAGAPLAAPEETADAASISPGSAALKQSSAERSGKIEQLTTDVQGSSYEPSSAATSTAIVQNALSEHWE